jgi:hypothetical protein
MTKRTLRHYVDGEALRDYLRCPQEYAYRWYYQVPDRVRTIRQVYHRALRRTALSIAREHLTGKPLTTDRSLLLWQLSTRHTPIALRPRLHYLGRNVIARFLDWLTTTTVHGLSVPRQLTFAATARRQIDVEITADIFVTINKRPSLVLLAPPDPGLIADLAQCDTDDWVVFTLATSTARCLPKATPSTRHALAGVIEQGFRGLSRRIVWPNRDSRCRTCTFADICQPADARRYTLQHGSKRERVRKQIARRRAHHDGAQDPPPVTKSE